MNDSLGQGPPGAAPPSRNWEVFCHLSGLATYLGIPLGNILGPLIIWLLRKDQYPSLDAHGKEALNFQISMTIWGIIAGLTIFILIGFVLLPIVVIAHIVLTILATLKASRGEFYHYPFTFRLIT